MQLFIIIAAAVAIGIVAALFLVAALQFIGGFLLICAALFSLAVRAPA